MSLESKVLTGFSLTIFQGRLDHSVSAIGSMSPQILILYENRRVKSRVATDMDRFPVWQETFNFESASPDLQLIVFHKSLILKDVEIGRCSLRVQDTAGWFEVKKNNKKVGALRLAIHEDRDTQLSTLYSSKDSCDIRDDCLRKMNKLELEKEEALYYKRKYKSKLLQLKFKRNSSGNGVFSGDFTEFTNFESADSGSEELVLRIQCQVGNLQQSIKELIKRKKLLAMQEENLNIEKEKVAQEWEEIHKKKVEVAEVKKKIKEEQFRLKGEQKKVEGYSLVMESERNEGKKGERIRDRGILAGRKMCGMLSPVIRSKGIVNTPEVFQSCEDLQEKVEVNKVPMTVEKSRPPLHPLSGNSSRLITFE